MEDNKKAEIMKELDWINIREEIGLDLYPQKENGIEKLSRKIKQNPLVPIGK